jgi:hypothetical protein
MIIKKNMAKEKKTDKTQLVVISRLEEEALTVPTKLKSEDDLLAATDLILKARKMFTELDGRRKERTAPANETIKLINEDYKKFLEPLQGLEKKLRAAIETYVNDKIESDLIKLEAMRLETGDKTLMIPIGFSKLPSASGEVRFRRTYSVEIVDAAKVPKEYRGIDTKAIERVVDAAEGQIKIPGVRIIPTVSTALYTN